MFFNDKAKNMLESIPELDSRRELGGGGGSRKINQA